MLGDLLRRRHDLGIDLPELEDCLAEHVTVGLGRADDSTVTVGDETVSGHGVPERALLLPAERLRADDDGVIRELAEVEGVLGGVGVDVGVGAVIEDEVEPVEVGDLPDGA